MTRKEQIANAAREYTDKVIFVSPSTVLYFEAGAEWADRHPKNIWHDADKMPNKSLPIIIEIEDDIDPIYEVIIVDGADDKFWKYLTSDRDITRWAYIRELLPKNE